MEGQYYLKWNNHHNTLISVFDSLLGSGKHVDCTLAAEGRELGAHKVVLSACSPYLESLLNKPSEKHPIIIFNDVKYDELKAILEYMYRGEVNVLQEQLAGFLKAAEALQIKGLTDQGGGSSQNDNERESTNLTNNAKHKHERPAPENSEDSPTPLLHTRQEDRIPNRRKRQRRMSQEKLSDNVDSSNSCDTTPTAQVPPSTTHPPQSSVTKIETDRLSLPAQQTASLTPAVVIKEKLEPTEILLQPKSEFLDDPNSEDKFIEDLTLDDDEEDSRYNAKPGPSHVDSQEYNTSWHLGDRSMEDSFLNAQDVMGNQSNSQGPDEQLVCEHCGRWYRYRMSLESHMKTKKCWKESRNFHCQQCSYKATTKQNLLRHINAIHDPNPVVFFCTFCPFKTKQKPHLNTHVSIHHWKGFQNHIIN